MRKNIYRDVHFEGELIDSGDQTLPTAQSTSRQVVATDIAEVPHATEIDGKELDTIAQLWDLTSTIVAWGLRSIWQSNNLEYKYWRSTKNRMLKNKRHWRPDAGP